MSKLTEDSDYEYAVTWLDAKDHYWEIYPDEWTSLRTARQELKEELPYNQSAKIVRRKKAGPQEDFNE